MKNEGGLINHKTVSKLMGALDLITDQKKEI